MKKSKKLGAVALCALVSASTLAISPDVINNVKADSIPELKIPALQQTYSIDASGCVTIPELSGTGFTTKVYELGSTEEVTDLDTSATAFKFQAKAKQYSVVYTGVDGSLKTSKTFIISIDYKDATFSLDESNVIIPEITVKGADVVLPYPVLKDSDGNKVELDYANDVTITVSSKSRSSIDVVDSDKVFSGDIKFKKFNANNAGTYTVKYKVSKQGYDEIVKTYTIKAEPSMQTQAEITFTLNGNLPTLVLNKECSLPTVTATDKTNEKENIKVRADVSYYILAQDGTKSNETIVENFKFTPKQEGYYVFKYKVTDAFGNVSKTKTYKVATKVVDTEAPVDMVVCGSYSVGEDGEAYLLDGTTITTQKVYDLSCRIPTNVNAKVSETTENTTITIPAVFAKDNDSFDKLTFTRTLKRYGTGEQSGNVVETIDLGEDGNNCQKLITVQVVNAGNYILTYKVKDSKGNETKSKDYNINVLAGTWVDTVAPVISWAGDIDATAKWGKEIKISKPSSSDLNDAGQVADLNIENVMNFYYSFKKNDETEATLSNKEVVRPNSSNKYAFKLYDTIEAFKAAMVQAGKIEETDTVSNIQLCCEYTSIDDNGNGATNPSVKKIDIVGATEVPAVTYTQTAATKTQGDEITIDNVVIKYSDAAFNEYLKDVDVYFEVINRENKSPVTTYGSAYTIDDSATIHELTVSGTKFLASFAGNYDIVLTVTDINGNTFVKSAVFEGVLEKTNNGRIVLDKDTMTLELGSTDTSAKICTMYKNGAKVTATDDNLKIEVTSGTSVTLDSNKNIIAKNIGDSTITYSMYTEDGLTLITTASLNITVQDTEKPEMIFAEDNPFSGSHAKDVAIALPQPTISDKSGINTDGLVIKVTHNGSDVTVTDNKFTPTEDGNYTVEYKVTDRAGNSTTKTFTVGVGDLEGPVVDVKNVPASKEVGSIYTVDVNDLVIYDEYDESFAPTLGDNTIITLKDASGNEIKSLKDGEYSFKLETAGNYTLTIKSTDKSNKTTTIDKTIVVSEAEPEPAGTSMAGTVIAIIGALALLGFVIYWFFKPEKATSSRKNKGVDKAKKDSEDKK